MPGLQLSRYTREHIQKHDTLSELTSVLVLDVNGERILIDVVSGCYNQAKIKIYAENNVKIRRAEIHPDYMNKKRIQFK